MRIRQVKPEFFNHDGLASLPPLHRILFAGLWCISDREGRLEDRPVRIKALVLPYDSVDVDPMLSDLEKGGHIIRYEADRKKCIAIPSWQKHQRPHHQEAPSIIPPPSKTKSSHHGSSRTRIKPEADLDKSAGFLVLGSGILDLGAEKKTTHVELALDAPPLSLLPVEPKLEKHDLQIDQVFAYWAVKLEHPRAKLDPKRKKLLRDRFAEGATAEELKLAVDGVLIEIESWPDRRRFDGIEYVFKNRGSVEKFMDLAAKGAPPKPGLFNPSVRGNRGPTGLVDTSKL